MELEVTRVSPEGRVVLMYTYGGPLLCTELRPVGALRVVVACIVPRTSVREAVQDGGSIQGPALHRRVVEMTPICVAAEEGEAEGSAEGYGEASSVGNPRHHL